MRYKNKVDLWIRLLLYFCVFMFVPIMFFTEGEDLIVIVLSFVFVAALCLPFLHGYVQLDEEELIVRVGFFRQRIQYEDIKHLRMCTNFLSSMATTKDRIEIKLHHKSYLRGTIFIGPLEREECFYELTRRCRNLEQ